MKPFDIIEAQTKDSLPNDPEVLKKHILLLLNFIGLKTMENLILTTQLQEAEEALLNVQSASITSRV